MKKRVKNNWTAWETQPVCLMLGAMSRKATDDPRAKDVLVEAYEKLQETAVKIANKRMRHSFLKKVAANRKLILLYEHISNREWASNQIRGQSILKLDKAEKQVLEAGHRDVIRRVAPLKSGNLSGATVFGGRSKIGRVSTKYRRILTTSIKKIDQITIKNFITSGRL